MKPEEKQLLLKDLCARLPYGVKLNFYAAATKENYTCTLLGIEPNDDKSIIAKADSGAFMFPAEHIKPYLRPMSSMTEEEIKELSYESSGLIFDAAMNASQGYNVKTVAGNAYIIDYLIAHHIDYRGLIEKGLALEAPEEMYEI